MIYLVLAALCLALPWTRQYGLLLFIILLLSLPVSNAFSLHFSKGGLFFYEFYFLSLFARFLIEQRLAGKWAILGILMVTISAFIALAGGVKLDLYFLRDFRLILYLLTLLCLISLQHRSCIFTGLTLKWLAVFSGASCIVYALIIQAELFQFGDEYYVRNSFRYFAVSTYFCFGFFAFSSFLPATERRGNLFYVALGVSLIGIFLSGLRVMSVLALMLFTIGAMKSKREIVIAILLPLFLTLLFLFSQIGGDREQSVVPRAFDISLRVIDQIQIRFLPFFLEFEKFRPSEVWLGGGFGQTFDIPWFGHRESKDSINNFVDSTYLTLYAKFGIFAPLLLAMYALSYSRLVDPKGRSMVGLVPIGLGLLWTVYPMPYQMTAVGLALLLFLMGSANRSPDGGNHKSYRSGLPLR